jgi:hypothetical protein
MPYGSPDLVPLVGGSGGGSTDSFGDNHGGGAVELVSGTSILIGTVGTINMGGGGGVNRPGVGGGSGGAILLEAPSVTVRGVLAANGGAGAAYGNAYGYGAALPSDQPASGQDAKGMNVAGNGSAGATSSGGNATVDPNFPYYAGGGGGAGRIRINTGCGGTLTVVPSAVISPYESTGCFTKGVLR